MVGVYLSLWVRRGILPHVRGVQVTSIGTGMLGYLGNKGHPLAPPVFCLSGHVHTVLVNRIVELAFSVVDSTVQHVLTAARQHVCSSHCSCCQRTYSAAKCCAAHCLLTDGRAQGHTFRSVTLPAVVCAPSAKCDHSLLRFHVQGL